MFKQLIVSFFLAFFSFSLIAQEGIKPLSHNINYLYGDLKVTPKLHNNTPNFSRSSATLTLPFVEDFSYSPTQSYPDQNLWSDSSTYINSGFAVAPWSIGVATFDGLNKKGYPYTPNLTNLTYSLPADTLTSKPIDLSLHQIGDSVALTFYYQARGNGDSPEITDSLLLDFYKPLQNKWTTVWYQRGNSSANTNDSVFKRGFVWVDSSYFFQNGFKFRFRNKATTAGDFDHWHLDYVNLNINRSIIKDTNYIDYAFGYIPTPYIKNYTSMPWRQYDTLDMQPKNSVFIRNNGILNSQLTYTNNFYDNNTNSLLHGYTSGAINVNGIFKYAGWIKDTVVSNPRYKYKFPLMTSPAVYRIQHILFKASVDTRQANDTVIQYQTFSNYFAFDDGSAEGGYYILGTGAKMAGKYVLKKSDTLRAVRIYFDPAGSLTLAQSYAFRINIWQAGPFGPSSVVIYRDSVMNPQYHSSGFNVFTEFKLASPQILSPGTYYIGMQQQVASGIVIGFDKNINHSSSLYFDSGSGWTQSSIYGSLMFRPVFGAELPLSIKEANRTDDHSFFVYPNPCNDILTIKLEEQDLKNTKLQLLNTLGQVLMDEVLTDQNFTISTQTLSNGIYFLVLTTNSGLVQQRKIIIQH